MKKKQFGWTLDAIFYNFHFVLELSPLCKQIRAFRSSHQEVSCDIIFLYLCSKMFKYIYKGFHFLNQILDRECRTTTSQNSFFCKTTYFAEHLSVLMLLISQKVPNKRLTNWWTHKLRKSKNIKCFLSNNWTITKKQNSNFQIQNIHYLWPIRIKCSN